jgi:aryl-alcohol dehydrogenase-like predicted oxidoreductase
MPSRLALGTVQFGMSYGVTNTSGQVEAEEIARILDLGRAAGMDTLDTAIAYGDSEQRLGDAGVQGWRVVTKLGAPPPDTGSLADWLQAAVGASLAKLKLDRLAGLLVHRSAALLGRRGQQLLEALQTLKRDGVVEKIGVSIYDPEELAVLDDALALDLVQAPYNVLDRRIVTSGWHARLKAHGVEVHTRSAYLQGLLLLEAEALPPVFEQWRPLWREWNAWLAHQQYTAVQACLGFVCAQPGIDRVVIGVENERQLHDAIRASATVLDNLPDGFACSDLELINPARWRIA